MAWLRVVAMEMAWTGQTPGVLCRQSHQCRSSEQVGSQIALQARA